MESRRCLQVSEEIFFDIVVRHDVDITRLVAKSSRKGCKENGREPKSTAAW